MTLNKPGTYKLRGKKSRINKVVKHKWTSDEYNRMLDEYWTYLSGIAPTQLAQVLDIGLSNHIKSRMTHDR